MNLHRLYWLSITSLIVALVSVLIIGFATTFPVNWWLVKSGIKEAM